jgi:2-C-methyl-D-erythritol 4-phosphate cytidylyltransferase
MVLEKCRTPRAGGRGVCEAILEWRPFIRLSANAPPMPPHASSRLFVLIPCAGSGHRAGHAQSTCPSSTGAGRRADGVHTLDAFRALTGASPGWRWWCADDTRGGRACPAFPRRTNTCCAWAGVTRAATVRNGLAALRQRPAPVRTTGCWCTTRHAAWSPEPDRGLIAACAHDAVGGLLAHPLADTLKVSRPTAASQTLARADKWLAQTPQMFRIGMLLDALERSGRRRHRRGQRDRGVWASSRCWCPAARRTSR